MKIRRARWQSQQQWNVEARLSESGSLHVLADLEDTGRAGYRDSVGIHRR